MLNKLNRLHHILLQELYSHITVELDGNQTECILKSFHIDKNLYDDGFKHINAVRIFLALTNIPEGYGWRGIHVYVVEEKISFLNNKICYVQQIIVINNFNLEISRYSYLTGLITIYLK